MTSFMAPFIIPAVFSFLGHQVNVDIWGLFTTLVLIVVIPIVLYFTVIRRLQSVHRLVKRHNKVIPTLILGFILTIVIASQKDTLIEDIHIVYVSMILLTVLFAVLYGFGYVFTFFVPKADKVSYIFASGAMNNSLAVGLAFAYFDSITVIFIVLSEVVWTICVAVGQNIFSRRPSQ